jgi:RNA polymerase sigma factor (sigma-70 family)
VRRQVAHDEATGDVPPGAIDPPAVVDEVARRALTFPQSKPDRLGYLLWLYALARQELQRRRKALRLQARQIVPLDPVRLLEDEAETSPDTGAAAPESDLASDKDFVRPANTLAPDEAAARKELLEQMQQAARAWPKLERDFFELYFIEGFEPHDIAMILRVSASKAEETLASVQAKLREELLSQSDI